MLLQSKYILLEYQNSISISANGLGYDFGPGNPLGFFQDRNSAGLIVRNFLFWIMAGLNYSHC